ncbi:thioredoxin family protein [Priestia megaterium]
MRMSKKFLFSSVVILIIGLLLIINTQYKEKKDLYSDQTSLAQLEKDIEQNKDIFVYYYQVNCTHCQKVSPYLIPLGQKQDVKFEILNLEKYTEGWRKFRILETPTLVHYKNGVEINRIKGEHSEEEYKIFFKNQ